MWFYPHAGSRSVFANPEVVVTDPAAVLGIPPDADVATIKRAYRRRVLETHPDRGGKHEEFLAVTKAYQMVTAGDWGRPAAPPMRAQRAPSPQPSEQDELAQALEMAKEYHLRAQEEMQVGNLQEGRNQLKFAAAQVARAEAILDRSRLAARDKERAEKAVHTLRRLIDRLWATLQRELTPGQELLEEVERAFNEVMVQYQAAAAVGDQGAYQALWLAVSDLRRSLERIDRALAKAPSATLSGRLAALRTNLDQLRGAIWQSYAAHEAASALLAQADKRLKAAKSNWKRKRPGAAKKAAREALEHAEQAVMVSRDIADRTAQEALWGALSPIIEDAEHLHGMAGRAGTRKRRRRRR